MKKLFSVLLIAACVSGCTHPDVYPDIPTLEFKSLTFGVGTLGNTFTLTSTFTDGDGDIGYYQDRPNDSIFDDSLSQYYYNFVIALQVYRNGSWKDTTMINYIDLKGDQDPTNDDTVFYNPSARIPYLTQTGQNKGLKGDIEKTEYLPLDTAGHILRYRAFIYDRALHKSNEIYTPGYFIQNP